MTNNPMIMDMIDRVDMIDGFQTFSAKPINQLARKYSIQHLGRYIPQIIFQNGMK